MDCVTGFISDRKRNRNGDAGYLEMMRRLRLGNLRTLLRDRNGPTLPGDDAGREYLWGLLLPISVGPNADIKMANAIRVWAPWMGEKDVGAFVQQINLTPMSQRRPTRLLLGQRLNVTYAERERLRVWTIAPCDTDKKTRALLRKQKERARKRRLRELRGCKPRAVYEANSINRTKPWIALGISRRTWYRRFGTSPSEVKLTKVTDTPVPTQLRQVRKEESAVQETSVSSIKSAVKSEKPESPVNDTVVTVIAQQVSGRTCAKTEQTVEIGGTACLNPDAVLAPRWLTPQIEEIPWDDHWHLVYLRLLKSDEGVVSEKAS